MAAFQPKTVAANVKKQRRRKAGNDQQQGDRDKVERKSAAGGILRLMPEGEGLRAEAALGRDEGPESSARR